MKLINRRRDVFDERLKFRKKKEREIESEKRIRGNSIDRYFSSAAARDATAKKNRAAARSSGERRKIQQEQRRNNWGVKLNEIKGWLSTTDVGLSPNYPPFGGYTNGRIYHNDTTNEQIYIQPTFSTKSRMIIVPYNDIRDEWIKGHDILWRCAAPQSQAQSDVPRPIQSRGLPMFRVPQQPQRPCNKRSSETGSSKDQELNLPKNIRGKKGKNQGGGRKKTKRRRKKKKKTRRKNKRKKKTKRRRKKKKKTRRKR